MTEQEIHRLEMFRRVRNFGASHEPAFPAGTLARDLFDTIGSTVNDLEGFAAEQSSGRASARQHTASKATARAAIQEDLEIISRTARAMTAAMPGLDDKFRLPRKANDQMLLDTARAFVADAAPLKAEFLRREVREVVFQDLEENITAFQTALKGQYDGSESSVTAVIAIDTAIEHAMNALRQLDTIVRNKLHDKPAELAAWESARHVERAPRRSKPDTPQAPPAPQQ